MTENAQNAQAGGNTKTPAMARKWCYTLCNWTVEEYDVLKCAMTTDKIKWYIIGKEVCPTTGTPHLQGFFEFNVRNRPSSLKLSKRIHFEPKCKGSVEDNYRYCSKEGDFVSNIECDEVIKTLDECKLFKWQEWLLNIIKGPVDDRKIYWIWEKNGNVGKSVFCKFLCLKYGGLMVGECASDMMCAIANYKECEKKWPKLIINDCPREKIELLNYGALEKCKNGHVFSGKYESKQLIFNCPHVIVFANEPPNYSKWSEDRYVVKELERSECVYVNKKLDLKFD